MIYIIIFCFVCCIFFIEKKFTLYSIYKTLAIFLLIYILFYFLMNPSEILIPYNYLLENICEKKVFYSANEKKSIFPTSQILENNWKMVRNEFINLKDEIKTNIWKNFANESEEFWKGWDTFPLRIHNKDNEENMKKCNFLSQILKSDTNITTAFFSIMRSGKILPTHYGPFKGVLRYHLGLIIPPKESGDCFISVDNEIYEWKEGEGILFDETYKHFVKNETSYERIILFLDVKRNFKNKILNTINDFVLYLMKISPYNK